MLPYRFYGIIFMVCLHINNYASRLNLKFLNSDGFVVSPLTRKD